MHGSVEEDQLRARASTRRRARSVPGGNMDAIKDTCSTAAPQGLNTPATSPTVPFMSRSQAEAVGMLDVQYCCDVGVGSGGRQLGYDTVLRHGYDLVHHREAGQTRTRNRDRTSATRSDTASNATSSSDGCRST